MLLRSHEMPQRVLNMVDDAKDSNRCVLFCCGLLSGKQKMHPRVIIFMLEKSDSGQIPTLSGKFRVLKVNVQHCRVFRPLALVVSSLIRTDFTRHAVKHQIGRTLGSPRDAAAPAPCARGACLCEVGETRLTGREQKSLQSC